MPLDFETSSFETEHSGLTLHQYPLVNHNPPAALGQRPAGTEQGRAQMFGTFRHAGTDVCGLYSGSLTGYKMKRRPAFLE